MAPQAAALAPAQPASPPVPQPAALAAAATTAAAPALAAASSEPILVAAPPARAPEKPPESAGPLSSAEVVQRANAYLNGLTTLVGDFTQVGADGRRVGGKIYLHRPGRLRFAYDSPSNLEVIADGTSVAVRDRKLATQDLYAIAQTPLKFLLREDVELGRDVRVVEAVQEGDAARVVLEDRSTLGGTSRITLTFDRNLETLQRWRVVDPQGFQTSVSLSNLDRTRRVDNRLFVINYETFRDSNR